MSQTLPPPGATGLASDDQGPKVVVVLWVLTVIPALFVALRLYTRITLSKSYGWDDTVIVAAWVLLLVYTSIITKARDYGVGRHYWTLEQDRLVNAYLFIYIGQTVIIEACSLSKTAFAFTLLRIVTKKFEKLAIWYIILSLNIVMLLCGIFQFVQCKNPAYGWDKSIKTECWPLSTFVNYTIFAGAYSAACDFALALYPWVILKSLNMKRREKVGVGLAMSLGVFAGATAIIKTTKLPALSKQVDYTYAGSDTLLWAGAETGSTIAASSIAVYRPLLKKVMSYVTSSQKSSFYVLENFGPGADKPGHRAPSRMHGRATSRGHRTIVGEGESDRSILPLHNQIKKTSEVTISYASRA
ncbi:uncharacterized protein Z518_08514 [Rhinocladiella mackenziei CBS 650.93]|uniref:Rhodopsin domain-containing protein n=1 Tax=Rhinocladiella mackenziei CBS 650.93 TaxID=1442369 RepID=A0A0D2GWI2_9EURO|nr:uncharacterized protein Z518_08514 [Rhinocladiella mackenziei CBS 650.93]KIX02573.1 hypothetical protein Z518_08514 [Rhinocladiella mackenziei CBS 650.93]